MSAGPFTVHVVRLPKPQYQLKDQPQGTGAELKRDADFPSLNAALEQARPLVGAGYGVEVSGPDGLRLLHPEVCQHLDSLNV